MFGKKRKLDKFRFSYGRSPRPFNSSTRYRPPQKFLKKSHPALSKFGKILSIILVIGLIGYFSYLIFFSNYFKIKDVAVINKDFSNETLSEEIQSSLSNIIGKNIFLIDTEELEKKVIGFFPQLESITLGKNYPDTLEIEFSEHPLVANVINESTNLRKNYIINSVGYAIKEDLENHNLPYIRMKSDEPVNTELPLIEKNQLSYILNAITYFEDKFGMQITEVEYKKIPREIHLLTERKFYIWLDIQRPAEDQFKKLKKALVKLDIYKDNLEYIDLRIAGSNGDKIIYKRKS